jgi:DNA-binding transcriptional regulator YiaG
MDVKSLRKSLNLKQSEFAAQLGISEAYVGHMEQGRRRPSLKLAAKMERLARVEGLVASVVAEQTGDTA